MKYRLLAGAAAFAMTPGVVQAQESGGGGVQLDEVVVTAERRETSLQRTPVAVTAISGEDLARQGVVSIDEAITFVPGVQVQGANTGASFYVRGVGARGASELPASPVSVSYDGVVQQRNELTGLSFADVARVEVLRGPQGTLYGRNANAGAVNVIYNDPELGVFGGDVSVSVGNYDMVRTEGVANLPLGDKAALRLVAGSHRRDGYLSNGLSDADENFVRAKLKFQPVEAVDLVLSAERQTAGGLGSSNVLLPTSGRNDPWKADDYGTLYTVTLAPVDCSPSCRPFYDLENTTLRGQLNWRLGIGQLTAIVGRQEFDRTYRQVFSGTWEEDRLPVQQSTAEVRLSSLPQTAWSWVIGAYYLDYDGSGQRRQNWTFDQGTLFTLNTSESRAVFGQATVPLSEQLRLTGGLRYTRDEVRQSINQGTLAQYADGTIPIAAPVSNSYDKVTWKAGLEYDIAPAVMGYVTASTGIKAGGVNMTGLQFGPEEIQAYEAGLKSRWLASRLQLNLAGYYYDYTGYQLSYYYYVANVPQFVTANVPGTTEVYGLEAEGLFAISRSARLDASLSYQKSSFGEALVATSCAGGACTFTNLAGLSLPRTPEWTLTLGYEHDWNLQTGGRLTARADVQWKSEYEVDLLRFNYSKQDAYALVNGRVTYEDPSGAWSASVFANNLTDEAVLEQANKAGPVSVYGIIGAPRTYGVSLSAHF
jgi:iron complex outermembrane receptor protein